MADPAMMMLDEPSLGLAPLKVDAMFDIVGELNRQGRSIRLVEQNIVKSLVLCARAYVIQSGEIVLVGAGGELLANDEVWRSYLGL